MKPRKNNNTKSTLHLPLGFRMMMIKDDFLGVFCGVFCNLNRPTCCYGTWEGGRGED
jgi:hypothetical protein